MNTFREIYNELLFGLLESGQIENIEILDYKKFDSNLELKESSLGLNLALGLCLPIAKNRKVRSERIFFDKLIFPIVIFENIIVNTTKNDIYDVCIFAEHNARKIFENSSFINKCNSPSSWIQKDSQNENLIKFYMEFELELKEEIRSKL